MEVASSNAPDPGLPAAPKGALVCAALLCGVVGASAVAGTVAALLSSPHAWLLFGFEVVVLMAAVLGFLTGRGRFPQGPALALACVAGCVVVGSVLGYLGSGRNVSGVGLKPFLMVRLLLGAGIGIAGAWIVLARRPGVAVPRFVKGVLVGLPLPILGAVLWAARARLAALPEMARIGGAVVLFVVVTALLAASVDLIVRAFETGRREEDGGIAAPEPRGSGR